MNRREFLRSSSGLMTASLATSLAGCASVRESGQRVIVVGGGFGGATVAKYLRMWAPQIQVTLIEREAAFVSCPFSNLVVSGYRSLDDLTVGYGGLEKNWGVRVVRAEATAVDADKKQLRLAGGEALPFDRIILSPGVDFMYEQIPGLNNTAAQARVLHAWKAGPQTLTLRRQLEALPDGGVFAISIPELPFRCPPAPYERACLVAAYFRKAKPKSKLIVLDANMDVAAEPALFKRAWAQLYPGVVEYRPNNKVVDVDVAKMEAIMEVDELKVDLLNVLPPMKAGAVANPFITVNQRWCEVDWLTYESKVAPGVHLLGDALQTAPLMPKSGHMANAHGKACAAAVAALLTGQPVNHSPTLVSTCYSFVSEERAMHVASVHKYDPAEKTMKSVPGTGGVSAEANGLEVQYADAWGRNIRADMLG